MSSFPGSPNGREGAISYSGLARTAKRLSDLDKLLGEDTSRTSIDVGLTYLDNEPIEGTRAEGIYMERVLSHNTIGGSQAQTASLRFSAAARSSRSFVDFTESWWMTQGKAAQRRRKSSATQTRTHTAIVCAINVVSVRRT